LNRKVRINEFTIHDPDGLMLYTRADPFFSLTHSSLTRLGISRSRYMMAGFPMIKGFPCLRRLELANTRVDSMEAAFIASVAGTLEELHLHKVLCTSSTVNNGMVMRALRVLSIQDSLSAEEAPPLIAACPALADLRLCMLQDGARLIEAAAAHCPHLQVLNMFMVLGVSSAVLCSAFRKLTELRVVILCLTAGALDDALETLVMHCPHLYGLHLFEGTFVAPQRTLQSIGRLAGNRLTHLSLARCSGATTKSLLSLASQCSALVDCALLFLKLGRNRGLAAVLTQLTPQLTALDLTGSVISSAVVHVLCERFQALKHLTIKYPAAGSDLHCIPTLISGLPDLKRLCVLEDGKVDKELISNSSDEDASSEANSGTRFAFSDADVQAWRKLRPDLVITERISSYWYQFNHPKFPEANDDSSVGDSSSSDGEYDDDEDDEDTEDTGTVSEDYYEE
jgi:hypothetical protein